MMWSLDIETARIESKVTELPEPDVALGNLKDPEKIAAKIAEAKARQVSEMALSPLTGKIVSVAMVGEDGEEDCCVSDNEGEVLDTIFARIGPQPKEANTICTWNGNDFDLPFIYKRAMLTGHVAGHPLAYWTRRYSTTPHCDLMQVWGGWNTRAKLDTVAQAVLGRGKYEFDVLKIPELIKTYEGREQIRAYNLHDATLTMALWHKFSQYLF